MKPYNWNMDQATHLEGKSQGAFHVPDELKRKSIVSWYFFNNGNYWCVKRSLRSGRIDSA